MASDILEKILNHKRDEVAERKACCSVEELQAKAEGVARRGFAASIFNRIDSGNAAVIAEVKRASPSRGLIRENFDPVQIAQSYAGHGATTLSILTDESFFQGSDDFLVRARQSCDLPCLRKEFIIDPYQIYESAALGADCILLIAAALTDEQLFDFSERALDVGVDVLVEVHDDEELERALPLPAQLLGINNRDLRTFETRLETTLGLLEQIPPERVVVTESGIHSHEDVILMRSNGVHAFLIGEAFMRASEPGVELENLFKFNADQSGLGMKVGG